MSNLDNYKKRLQSDLKLNGIIVRSEFCSLIIESLYNANISFDSFDNIVKIICDNLEKHTEVNRSIERKHVERAIEACIQLGIDDHETKLNIISAFEIPKLEYNITRKLYYAEKKSQQINLFGDSSYKNQLFQNRYRNVLQRTQRNLLLKNSINENEITLHTVDYLLTVSQMKLENGLILGSLFQGAYGKYYLEDPTGMVELNLSHAKYRGGFFYENCFVLVNGQYVDNVLKVATILLPPGEEYTDSKPIFGNLNYFGGESETLLRESKKLAQLMHENAGGMIVFISDLWLDKSKVFEKLETLFNGLSSIPPIAFVFLGNFLSQCYTSETLSILTRAFTQLAQLINRYETIVKYSHFVFVPGFNDPAMLHIIPRLSLPKTVTNNFRKIIPKSTFTTNPCRIQYCTREIVVFRADVLSKFMQESLNKPTRDRTDDYITRTIISQGHLSPFSLNVQPVHWSFDHTLHLYPLPNLIVIGDKCNPYSKLYKECCIMNPGSFVESGFSFKTYVPSTDTVEDCEL